MRQISGGDTILTFEALKPGARVRGLASSGQAEIVQVSAFGADALNIVFRADGRVGERLVYRGEECGFEELADETGLTVQVCHYPPGTSKWNRIEHRMFCHITQNWRGQPLLSRLAVVELIAATKTKTGLTVQCELDENCYAKAIKVTDAEMAALNITTDAWHPEWNYTIHPRRKT